jgi:hypothetical protein
MWATQQWKNSLSCLFHLLRRVILTRLLIANDQRCTFNRRSLLMEYFLSGTHNTYRNKWMHITCAHVPRAPDTSSFSVLYPRRWSCHNVKLITHLQPVPGLHISELSPSRPSLRLHCSFPSHRDNITCTCRLDKHVPVCFITVAVNLCLRFGLR